MIILALFSEVEFENFDVHRSDRDYATSSRTRGGGVFIAVRKSLGSIMVTSGRDCLRQKFHLVIASTNYYTYF